MGDSSKGKGRGKSSVSKSYFELNRHTAKPPDTPEYRASVQLADNEFQKGREQQMHWYRTKDK